MNKYMNDLTSWFKKLLLIICLNMRYSCFCFHSMELSHYFVTVYACDSSIGYGLIWGKRGPFHLLVPSLQTYLLVYKASDSRDLGQLNNCANKHESSYEISSHVSSVARLFIIVQRWLRCWGWWGIRRCSNRSDVYAGHSETRPNG